MDLAAPSPSASPSLQTSTLTSLQGDIPPAVPVAEPSVQQPSPSSLVGQPLAARARPWWQPPARNFRPHPGNRILSSYDLSQTTETTRSEGCFHYWYRALHYVLRIPFRQLFGPDPSYDPAAPEPLPDIPLQAGTVATTTGYHRFSHPRDYISQVKKAWSENTSNTTLLTALFTTLICTLMAAFALALNWSAQCTYLKVFLIAFVVRKWFVTVHMMNRRLYLLPLKFVEPDPDMKDELNEGTAWYLSQLFTWHGYAMFIFGSLYVFSSGAPQYLGEARMIAGVAIAFSCMGLTVFVALYTLLFSALFLFYLTYTIFFCMVWPIERYNLSRQRVISRQNGGYQSEGITNTTDLMAIARTLEDAENGEVADSGGVFGAVDNIKLIPEVAAIPIVIFRKQTPKPTPLASEGDQPVTISIPLSDPDTIIDVTNDMPNSTSTPSLGHIQYPEPVLLRSTQTQTQTRVSPQSSSAIPATINSYQYNASEPIADVVTTQQEYPTICDEECAICLFDFEDGDELRHLYCDHYFHRSCIDRWLVKNPKCPKCKRSLVA
ncbi:hypothetical protein BG011_009235 [Mortierella polycephala]|uniref:RING-type domain-containing protein n=1 Tax=Mortierella polycephala TaxID=41804 RepID=A0A9P6QAQ9_9FUNG|nr:hypothetical protein BG011_009235 [Mortierella polycephala]